MDFPLITNPSTTLPLLPLLSKFALSKIFSLPKPPQKMKHSSHNQHSILLHNPSKDEIEVVNILLDLENLVNENQYCSVIWGSKKRRSNRRIDFSTRLVNSSSSIQGSSKIEIEIEPKIKAEVTSPATPLSFSPSESDEKSKHSSCKSSKRKVQLFSFFHEFTIVN